MSSLTREEAAATAAAVVDRLRRGSVERHPVPDDTPLAEVWDESEDRLGSSLAFLLMADAQINTGIPASHGGMLRAAAITLSLARQSFLAHTDLDAAGLGAVMPVIGHLSELAESMLRLSDFIAVEMAAQQVEGPAAP